MNTAAHNAARPRINSKSPQHRAQVRRELEVNFEEIAQDVLADAAPHSADDFARRFVAALCDRFGGVEIYIPASTTARRDKAVREQFNGRNLREVCAATGLAPSTIYRIVGRRPLQPGA